MTPPAPSASPRRRFRRLFLPVREHPAASVAALVSVLAFAALTAPTPAFAATPIRAFMADAANTLFGASSGLVSTLVEDSILTSGWEDIFNTDGNSVLALVEEVCTGPVTDVANSVLALVAMVRFIGISQKMDSSGVMPALREIFVFAVEMAIFLFLVNNIGEILAALFDYLNSITGYMNELNVGGMFGTDYDLDGDAVTDYITADADGDYSSYSYGDLFVAFLAGFLTLLCSWAAYVLAIALAVARGLQLYVMAAFAPLPMAFLGIHETRQWGIGFFRNFAAVTLAGSIMFLLLISYPFFVASMTTTVGSVGAVAADAVVGMVWTALKMVAMNLMLIMGLVKSGQWARDILGG